MRFLPLLVMMTCLLASGCTDDKPSVAVVDMQRIVNDSTSGRQAQAHAAKVQEILQTNLNTIQVIVDKYPDKAQAQEILQAALAHLQQELTAKQNQITQAVLTEIRRTISDYQQKQQFDAILNKEGVLDYRQTADITADIVAAFEKANLDLPPLPKLEATPKLPAPKQNARPAAVKQQDDDDKKAPVRQATKAPNTPRKKDR